MAAKAGNKTAEKWTKESVLKLLGQIEQEARKPGCLYLGSALVEVKLYKDVWAYWKEKFAEDDDVFRPIKRIEQVFEAKLFSGGLKGDLNPTTVIFGLKNNHEWKDKTEVDQNIKGEVSVKKVGYGKEE